VFPRDMAETLRTRAGTAGLEVVYSEFYSNGTIDHSAALATIKGLAPDWIYITGYSQDLILARKQMHDIGLTAPIVTMITGPAYREFIEGLGPLAEGVTSVTWWHHTTTYESDDVWGSTKAFYEDFKSHESSDPDYIHAASAAALVAVQKAIESARSLEPTKISSALRTLNLTTFYGPIVFDEHGMNAARDLPILQVQGQEVKVLFPASIAQAKLAMFK
jgi:branched-chain amino acid transport system substrate-binding protein